MRIIHQLDEMTENVMNLPPPLVGRLKSHYNSGESGCFGERNW
jgi:hypothetical protein